MPSNFEIRDIDSDDLEPDKPAIRIAVKEVEPTCPREKCEVCTKLIFTCRCHDLFAALNHKNTWFCSESCWGIYAEGLGLRNYRSKATYQRIEKLTGQVAKGSGK